MPEKCALSHGSGVLGRDPRDHVEKVCTVTQFRLGEGGGGDTIGGGSANREPGSYIFMLIFSSFISVCMKNLSKRSIFYLCIYTYIHMI